MKASAESTPSTGLVRGFRHNLWIQIGFAFLGSALLLVLSCGGGDHASKQDQRSPVDAEILTWQGGKRCALTLAFDDTRETSFQLAAPLLDVYAFKGTFSVNSRNVRYWDPWMLLAERGHEIANHTRSHRDLSAIPTDEAITEVILGKRDLTARIPRLRRLTSFTYPFWTSSPEIKTAVMQNHLCARTGYGWNSPSPDDMYLLTGRPYVCVDTLKSDLRKCLDDGSWLIQCFHGIGWGKPNPISLADFADYLEYVSQLRDSIWVAPQGEIATYILERDNSQVLVPDSLPGWLQVMSRLDGAEFDVPLTVRINVGDIKITADLAIGEGIYLEPSVNHPR